MVFACLGVVLRRNVVFLFKNWSVKAKSSILATF